MDRAAMHAQLDLVLDDFEKEHKKFPTQVIILSQADTGNPDDPGEYVAAIDIYPQSLPAGAIIESLVQAARAIEQSAKEGMMPDIAASNETKH